MITKPYGQVIDNISNHETPEGVVLSLVTAGLVPRITAFMWDILIRIFVLIAIYIPLNFIGYVGDGIYAVIYFLIEWLYPVVFEVYREGATPGKKMQGIYVCHDDGTQVTLRSSLTRNLLRFADFLPMLFTSAILCMLFTKKSQRIGDILAGTIVVYKNQEDTTKIFNSVYGKSISANKFFDQQRLQNNNSLNGFDEFCALFTYPLTFKEQQSILGLSDRLIFLPKARQFEIVNHLSPLVFNNSTHNTLSPQRDELTDTEKAIVYDAVLAKSKQIRGGK